MRLRQFITTIDTSYPTDDSWLRLLIAGGDPLPVEAERINSGIPVQWLLAKPHETNSEDGSITPVIVGGRKTDMKKRERKTLTDRPILVADSRDLLGRWKVVTL